MKFEAKLSLFPLDRRILYAATLEFPTQSFRALTLVTAVTNSLTKNQRQESSSTSSSEHLANK